MTAIFGGGLLAGVLMTGVAGAQSSGHDTTKDSTSQQSQQSQPAQPGQPTPPAQVAPGPESKQSDFKTDYRSDTRSERVVVTERTKFLGMDPILAMIVGAVLFIVIVLAVVAMSRKGSTTTVVTRRPTMWIAGRASSGARVQLRSRSVVVSGAIVLDGAQHHGG